MFLKRIKYLKETLFIITFILLFLFTRIPGISSDVVNPDGVNWHNRAEQFVVGLKHMQLERTYQHYQPGITLMWVVGPVVETVKQFSGDIVYNMDTFLTFHYFAKVALIFVQLGLTFILYHLLRQVIDKKQAKIALLAFTFEPFFLANSRVLHLDILLTLLLVSGLLSGYIFMKNKKFSFVVLSAVLLSLATLTKSVAVGGLLFVLGAIFIWPFVEGEKKVDFKNAFSFLLISLLTYVAFFPALWVNFKEVMFFLYDGIERVGIRKGHNQIIFGEATRDAGVIFYPLIFLLKTSPFLIIFAIFGWVKAIKDSKKKLMNFGQKLANISLENFLGLFFLGYFIVMTISTKKIDRYFLPALPYLGLVASSSIYSLDKKLFWGIKEKIGLGILYIIFVVAPFINLYPYHFTYTNPLFGSPSFVHENILAQKPFGVGIPELKDFILTNYGDYPSLGFYDFKPMAAIYKGSRIYDITVDGTRRYDLLILGVNEQIPEKVLTSGDTFVRDSSVYINGLEYWKIYVKEDSNLKIN